MNAQLCKVLPDNYVRAANIKYFLVVLTGQSEGRSRSAGAGRRTEFAGSRSGRYHLG